MLCVCVFVHRSRFVQDKIDAGHPDDIALCYQELRPHIALLMMDSFGHFAVGTILSLNGLSRSVHLLMLLHHCRETSAQGIGAAAVPDPESAGTGLGDGCVSGTAARSSLWRSVWRMSLSMLLVSTEAWFVLRASHDGLDHHGGANWTAGGLVA